MDIPVKRWYEGIKVRRSRRNYNPKIIPADLLDELKSFVRRANKRFNDARIVVINQNPDEVFKGAIGSYGKIKGAQAYAAFVGDMTSKNVQENLGYLGEAFILEATSFGLSTCWVGGFFRPEIVKEHITDLSPAEKVIAVTPIGYSDENFSIREKLMFGSKPFHKRKDINELCIGSRQEELDPRIITALEAARLAPSAVNRQPWRFTVEGKSIKISVDSDKDSFHLSKRLDCGIAMLHLEVGALYQGLSGSWEYLETPDVASFTVK